VENGTVNLPTSSNLVFCHYLCPLNILNPKSSPSLLTVLCHFSLGHHLQHLPADAHVSAHCIYQHLNDLYLPVTLISSKLNNLHLEDKIPVELHYPSLSNSQGKQQKIRT